MRGFCFSGTRSLVIDFVIAAVAQVAAFTPLIRAGHADELAAVSRQATSVSQSLTKWDGRGERIIVPPQSSDASMAALQRLGGLRVVFKVDADRLRRDLLATAQDEVRRALRETRIGYTALNIREGAVEVRIRNDADVLRAEAALTGKSSPPGRGLNGSVELTMSGDGLLRLAPLASEIEERLVAAVSMSVWSLKGRAAELGLDSPNVRQVGSDRIEALLPGLRDPARLTEVIRCFSSLSFRLIEDVVPKAAGDRHAGNELDRAHSKDMLYRLRKLNVVMGSDMRFVAAIRDPITDKPAVAFRLSARSFERMAQVTEENIGRSLAIVLTNEVIAAPVIREAIVDGHGKIEGDFTADEALELALWMQIATADAGFSMVEHETFDATKP